MKKLSKRQKLFCKYIAEGDNQSTAAIKAGYSEKGNRSRGCRLMQKDEIRAEIKRLQDEIATPRILSVMERKKRLTQIIRATLGDYFEVVNGQLQWKEGADKATAYSLFAIKTKIKTDKYGNIIFKTMSVKLPDTIKAIHELNKMDGIYRRSSKTRKTDSGQRKINILVRQPDGSFK